MASICQVELPIPILCAAIDSVYPMALTKSRIEMEAERGEKDSGILRYHANANSPVIARFPDMSISTHISVGVYA